MILYFYGTGNSRYVAKSLAGLLKEDTVAIHKRIRAEDHTPIRSEGPLIFVVPTYAWRVPRLVEEWITKMRFYGNQNAYFILTCGDSIGNAEKYAIRLCAKKKFQFMGVYEIVMPENYLLLFNVPEEPEAIANVMRADYFIEKAAGFIQTGKRFPGTAPTPVQKLSGGLVNELFYDFLVHDRKFYVTEDCVSCGHCAAVCPLHDIRLVDGVPYWSGKCTHCLRCITSCPTCAIEYGKSTWGKWRYHCPISIE